MTTAKEYLTGDLTDAEVERMNERMDEINEEFLDTLPDMRSSLKELVEGKGGALEQRTVTLALPPVFWEMTTRLTELFNINDTLLKNVPEAPRGIFEAFDSQNLTEQEVILSQAIADSILVFIGDIARVELLHRFHNAISNNDLDALVKIIQRMKEEKIDAPSSDDPKQA